jgi:hypothetical protein
VVVFAALEPQNRHKQWQTSKKPQKEAYFTFSLQPSLIRDIWQNCPQLRCGQPLHLRHENNEVRNMRHLLVLSMVTLAIAAGGQALNTSQPPARTTNGGKQITLPAGTTVLLQLRSPITTKNARVGDPVYCETSFPVTQDNLILIPVHTYVKGQIAQVHRPGRVKGRAEIQFHFNTLIFPDGYTVQMPGSLQNVPGAENSSVSGDEGNVKANGQKGKDAETIGTAAGTGAAIGGLGTGSIKGAGIGAGVGGAVGLAKVLLTRGQDVRIESGAAVEMLLQRPLVIDSAHTAAVHD